MNVLVGQRLTTVEVEATPAVCLRYGSHRTTSAVPPHHSQSGSEPSTGRPRWPTRTLYLSLPANHVATGEPAITGTAQAGQVLTADASPIVDDRRADPRSFTYQWIRVDADGTSNEAEISGETDATYTLTDDDVGKKVKVQVSFTDELSGEEMRTSAAYPSSGTVTDRRRHQHRADGGQQHGDGGRGHGVRLRGGRLRLHGC